MSKPNISNIINLAKISLDEEKSQEFTLQIENILQWVRQMDNLSIVPTTGSQLQNVENAKILSADIDLSENNIDPSNPKLAHGYFIVPKVINSE